MKQYTHIRHRGSTYTIYGANTPPIKLNDQAAICLLLATPDDLRHLTDLIRRHSELHDLNNI